MIKLELKYLLPYGAYRVKGKYNDSDEIWELDCEILETDYVNNKNPVYSYLGENACKPILRPLSDLTKEIEHNGEKLVPLYSLGEDIFYNWLKKEIEYTSTEDYEGKYVPEDYEEYFNIRIWDNDNAFGITFHHPDFDSDEDVFKLRTNNFTSDKSIQKDNGCLTFGRKKMNGEYVLNFKGHVTMYGMPGYKSVFYFDLKHWNQLFEWHFDVFGFLKKGLAIDINTLNNEAK